MAVIEVNTWRGYNIAGQHVLSQEIRFTLRVHPDLWEIGTPWNRAAVALKIIGADGVYGFDGFRDWWPFWQYTPLAVPDRPYRIGH